MIGPSGTHLEGGEVGVGLVDGLGGTPALCRARQAPGRCWPGWGCRPLRAAPRGTGGRVTSLVLGPLGMIVGRFRDLRVLFARVAGRGRWVRG